MMIVPLTWCGLALTRRQQEWKDISMITRKRSSGPCCSDPVAEQPHRSSPALAQFSSFLVAHPDSSSATKLLASRPGDYPSRTESFVANGNENGDGGEDSGHAAERDGGLPSDLPRGSGGTSSAIVVTAGRDIESSPVDTKAAWKKLSGAPAIERDEKRETISSSWLNVWTPFQILDESDDRVRFRFPLGSVLVRLICGNGTATNNIPAPVELTVRFRARGGNKETGVPRCRLVWEVRLPAASRKDPRNDWVQFLVVALIQWRMESFVDSVEGVLSEPLVLTRRLRLPARTCRRKAIGAADAMEAWLDFVWKKGGGLPTPLPPLPLPPSASRPDAAEMVARGYANRFKRSRRLIFPPGLVESLIRVDEGTHQIDYQVDNPGWFTYPVHTHKGRVSFRLECYDGDSSGGGNDEDAGGGVVLEWQVEIRPYAGARRFVQIFTEAVVTTLTRNLAVHLRDPGAVVRVSPPRGKGKSFASVRKDSWLGGVLDTHLADTRSTKEQMMALLQPWTWGRTDDSRGGGDDDAGSALTVWTTGRGFHR